MNYYNITISLDTGLNFTIKLGQKLVLYDTNLNWKLTKTINHTDSV